VSRGNARAAEPAEDTDAIEGDLVPVENPRRGMSTAVKAIGGSLLVAAVLGAGWLTYRHIRGERSRQEAVANLGALGIDAPSWLTDAVGSTSLYSLWAAASRQVALAKKGQRLARISDAADLGLFEQAATNNQSAYAKTAFWLAVASRLSGSNTLGKAAGANLAQAGGYMVGPIGTSVLTGQVGAIYGHAADLVHAEAAANEAQRANLEAVARRLARGGSAPKAGAEETALAPAEQEEGAPGAWALTKQAAVGIFTGATPTGMGSGTWGVVKWGARIGIVATALVVARAIWWPGWTPWGGSRDSNQPRTNLGDVADALERVWRIKRVIA